MYMYMYMYIYIFIYIYIYTYKYTYTNTHTLKIETDGRTQYCHYPFIYAHCRRLKTSNFIHRGWGGSLCRTSRQPTIIYILIFKGLSPAARSWGTRIFIHRRVEHCSTTVDSSPPRCSMPHRIFFYYFPSTLLELMYRGTLRCHFCFYSVWSFMCSVTNRKMCGMWNWNCSNCWSWYFVTIRSRQEVNKIKGQRL